MNKELQLLLKLEALHNTRARESKSDLTKQRNLELARQARADINRLPWVDTEIKLVRAI